MEWQEGYHALGLSESLGLAQVIAQQKLPKELLQSSLRPVLLNLADYRKLSVPLLQGLSRLLELLTNCFNVTLGEKLLEHLNKWTGSLLHSIMTYN